MNAQEQQLLMIAQELTNLSAELKLIIEKLKYAHICN